MHRYQSSHNFSGTVKGIAVYLLIKKWIVYRSEVEKAAVITGAEQVKSWEPYEVEVWAARFPMPCLGMRILTQD